MKIQNKNIILVIILAALIIKLSLFLYVSIHAPQGKFLPDSHSYLKLADTLAVKGVFAIQAENGTFIYEMLRTPGYPLFLAVLNGFLKIPFDGIVLIQIIMTLLAAYVTYRTAVEIDRNAAFLSLTIMLFDPPITIFSMTILTETIFLMLMAFFMLYFTLYLKKKKAVFVIAAALAVAAATYVRPVTYYLGFLVAFFILYADRKEDIRKVLGHALIFLFIIYSLLGVWQIRNYARCSKLAFSSVENENSGKGLFKSYIRNRDPYTRHMMPLPYYVNVTTRCVMSVMTRPGNFKYFKSELLTIAGKAAGYPWMVFWLTGFVWGAIKMKRNIYIQFMLYITAYFIITSIGALMWDVCERLRVPMMPFIAIISACGWVNLLYLARKRLAKQ